MIGNRLVLSIEIGKDYINGLKFSPSLKGPRFQDTGFATISVKEGEEWKDAASRVLKTALSAEKPDSIEIIAIIPGHLFFLRNYTFPITNPRKVRQAIPFEMEGDIPLPLENVVIDSVIMKSGGETEAFAFAIPREILKEYTDPFPDGFKPRVVIPDFVALSFLNVPESRSGTGILIETGHKKITFAAIHHKRLIAAHSIPLSSEGLVDREIKELVLTLKEWMERKIEIEKVYICGKHIKEIEKADIKSKLGIGIEPLKGYDKKELIFASLIGSGYMDLDINLLRSEEDARKQEVLRKRAMVSGIGLLILLFLGGIDLFLNYTLLNNQYNSLKSEVRQVFKEILPEVKNIVNEEVQLKTALDKEKKSLLLLKGGMLQSFDLLLVLDPLFENDFEDGLVITEVRIEEEIYFHGEAKDQGSVDTFIKAIKKEKGIKGVRIDRVEHRKDFLRFQGEILIGDKV
ncbi:MAG: hypothetical protein ACE5IH_06030 [Thermodesulfobacteriota bacterium]